MVSLIWNSWSGNRKQLPVMWHDRSCGFIFQTSIMKRCTLEFHPIAIVEHEGPIEFYTPPDEDYLDMNSQSLKLHYVL